MNDDYGDPSPPEDDPAITEEDPFVAPEAVVVGEIVDPFLGSRPLELTLEEIMARDERYEALRAIALRRLRLVTLDDPIRQWSESGAMFLPHGSGRGDRRVRVRTRVRDQADRG
jgi:hypothetical protein